LLLIGDPGLGKSALLGAAVARAHRSGARVLVASGLQSESELTFAGLHQLLRPVMGSIDRLPPRQAEALQAAFGMHEGPSVDRFLIGIATLNLLAEAAEEAPLLVAVDDAPTLDPASLGAVAFAVRRLQAEPITTIVTSRTEESVGQFDLVERLVLCPLTDDAAAALIAEQPWILRRDLHDSVLTEAAGNPLALIELASTARSADPNAAVTSATRLPTTKRLEQVFAERLRSLPAETRRLLTLASASDDRDLGLVVRAAESMGLDPDGFRQAEDAGLVFVVGDEFTCRHPIVRSVIYQAASIGERREAHRGLADALESEPERRAWHLAAVASKPDEAIASTLASTALGAGARGGFSAAARAFERAAELTPDRGVRAERLLQAIEMAFAGGRSTWVEELARRLDRETSDPYLRAKGRLAVAHVRAVSGRGMAANAVPMNDLEDLVALIPEVGVAMLALAAGIGFSTGDEPLRSTVQAIAKKVAGPGGEQWRLYALAACDASANARRIEPHLDALADSAATDPATRRGLAMTLWHLDHPTAAWEQLSAAVDAMRTYGQLNHLPVLLVVLGFTDVWRGRWSEARSMAAEAIQLAADTRQPLMKASGLALEALVAAVSGNGAVAHERASAAVGMADEAFTVAVAGWARGLEALGAGRFEEARLRFQEMFTPGSPAYHFEVSRWAIADLAEAAVRTGDPGGVAALVARAEERALAGTSSRATLLVRRAKALLATGDKGDVLFEEAVATERSDEWPFELARTRLAYGERLRRRRRILEARTWLRAALDTFDQLGAKPWADRARTELRAAGVAMEGKPPQAIDDLTPQQMQIVQLAAIGLSNRDIADKLFLSPRTVGFHLYNAFPKLQVSTRAQLANVLVDGFESMPLEVLRSS